MIYVYLDEDKDTRIFFVSGKIEEKCKFNRIKSNVHLYEHEGSLWIFMPEIRDRETMQNSLGKLINISGDCWEIQYCLSSDEFLNISKKKELAFFEGNDLKNADYWF